MAFDATPSKRSGINHNFPFDQGCLVDQLRSSGMQPFSTAYATGAMFNKDVLDDITQLPNDDSVKTRSLGGFGIKVPSSDDFAGPWVLTWDGNSQYEIIGGTWTVNAGLSSNYTENSNGKWTGTNPRIVMEYTGAGGSFSTRPISLDIGDAGFPTAFHFYRLEDEARFMAGKIFRVPYLQHYVDGNFSFIRHMNWMRANSSIQIRYRHRNKPEQQGFGGTNLLACDTYGEITGTNQYAIVDTADSPAAMEHGEVVQGRITNSQVRCGAVTITGITKAATGVVTYSGSNHPSNGDIVIFQMDVGMVELHRKPCTVANVNTGAGTFELSGVNTTGFTTFSAGNGSSTFTRFNQYVTLNRGGKGAYPIIFLDGSTPASNYGNSYIAANDYKYFVFHKTIIASTEVTGAWIFSDQGTPGYSLAIPVEIIAKFHAELDEMQVAQSIIRNEALGPTHCWVTIPHMGHNSMDPDYDVDDHFGIQTITTLLANLPARVGIFDEDGNETWNFGGTAFSQSYFQARLGQQRWGGSASDAGTYHALHACVLATDIDAAFPAEVASGRIRHVMAGQGALGTTGLNNTRINGNATLDADALFISLGGGDPIDYFYGFAWASYFLAGPTFDSANLATLAATYAAATNDIDREAACSSYVDGVIGTVYSESITVYRNTRLPDFADAMQAKGKIAMQYEGGWDKTVTGGTAEVNAFLIAVKKSRAWAEAHFAYFSGWPSQAAHPNVATNAYYPSDYVMIDQRWGHASPNTYLNSVEGAGLDLAWDYIGLYNRNITRFRATTS